MDFDPLTAATDRLIGERMSKHTPWKLHYDVEAEWTEIQDSSGNVIEVFYCFETARRIVAAVNACAGIPTDVLESGSKIIADYEKLQRQNAELLSLLEVSRCPNIGCDNNGTISDYDPRTGEQEPVQCQWCDERKTAIAKAKAEKC